MAAAEGRARRPGFLGAHLPLHPTAPCLGRCRPHPLVGAEQRQRLAGQVRRLAEGEGDQQVGHVAAQDAHTLARLRCG